MHLNAKPSEMNIKRVTRVGLGLCSPAKSIKPLRNQNREFESNIPYRGKLRRGKVTKIFLDE